jgi:hypothetical protein
MTHFPTRESLVETLKAVCKPVERVLINEVAKTHLSVARHYGGCTVQGERFTYLAEFDLLVKEKALKAARKWASDQAKPAKWDALPKRKPEPLPLDLFGG